MTDATHLSSGSNKSHESVPTILHVFPAFAIGGSQRRFAAIANHFGPSFRHMILPLNGDTEARSLLLPQVPYEIVALPFPKGALFRAVRRARQCLRQLKPDVLVTYNWGTIEWAAGNIPRLVRHVHIEDGFGPEEAQHQIRRRVWFRRLALNRHSTVVLPSRNLVKIATETWRLNQRRLVYLPNGIACAKFGGAADPALASLFQGKGPVIGTVATLRREKALDRLIDAFALVRAVRPSHLVIVGDGPERASLENKVALDGLKDEVTFTGNVSQPERFLGAFDVFAVSSDTEQMPLSILEAMAAGGAIASTDAGDIRGMLAVENQPFVVPLSVQALASALGVLLDDPALRKVLGAANRAKALAEYDEGKMFAGYHDLFKGV